MKSRLIPILNAIGCLVLTGLVAFQWSKERTSHQALQNLRVELAETAAKHTAAVTRSAALERDITVLKEAIESTQLAAEAAARDNATQSAQTSQLQADLTTAQDQTKTWEAALAERDAKLKQLNSELVSTRRRLDESIAKLKAAGAR